MMTMYKTINQRAESKFGKPINKETYSEFVKFWLAEAEAFKRELQTEGLWMSVDVVQSIIDEQRRWHERCKVFSQHS